MRRVRMVVMDVDGVLTDGRIINGSDGQEYKCFHVHDGYGIARARELGILLAIISGRTSKVTTVRARRLRITEVHQGNADKVAVFDKIKARHRLSYGQICFIGDDEFDIPLLRKVGVSAAPHDAIERVRNEVDIVTEKSGGRGAVRELLDMILRAKRLIE